MGESPDNDNALAAFIAHKAKSRRSLCAGGAERGALQRHADDASWGNVGTLANYLEGLPEISDAAFHEGEHAA